MQIQNQRRAHDCGVAALASYLSTPYEDVYVAAVAVSPRFCKGDGLTIKAMLVIAKAFGRPLVRVPWQRVDLDDDTGVLGINWNNPKAHGGAIGHWVVLRTGTIGDPQGSRVEDASDYLAFMGGRVGTLLKETS